VALCDIGCSGCCYSANCGCHLVTSLCVACGSVQTFTLETAKSVHLERVRPVLQWVFFSVITSDNKSKKFGLCIQFRKKKFVLKFFLFVKWC